MALATSVETNRRTSLLAAQSRENLSVKDAYIALRPGSANIAAATDSPLAILPWLVYIVRETVLATSALEISNKNHRVKFRDATEYFNKVCNTPQRQGKLVWVKIPNGVEFASGGILGVDVVV